jgi:hypothetical protein
VEEKPSMMDWVRAEIQSVKDRITPPQPMSVSINNTQDEEKLNRAIGTLQSEMKEYIQSENAAIRKELDEMQIIVNVPEQPAPIVTVNVPPAQVTVNVPKQDMVAQPPPQVSIVMPKVASEKQSVIRNAEGQIESTVTKIEYEK